jgi:hypothetical protein
VQFEVFKGEGAELVRDEGVEVVLGGRLGWGGQGDVVQIVGYLGSCILVVHGGLLLIRGPATCASRLDLGALSLCCNRHAC